MSPGSSSQSSKSKSKKIVEFNGEEDTGVKNRSKKVDEGDGFDVVESDPDEVTSSDGDDGCDSKKIDKKARRAKKEAERVKKRLAEIAQVLILMNPLWRAPQC